MEITVECPICMDDYSEAQAPFTCSCGHTFCTSCAKTLKKQGKITCPLDKTTFVVQDIKTNYEMLHLILESKEKFRISQEKQQELKDSLTKLQEEINESNRVKECIQLEIKEKELNLIQIKEKHKEDIAKKVSSAVIETEEKGKKRLKKKLKEQEEKIISKLEKEANLRKQIEDKKTEETLKAILKQKEEEMSKANREKEEMMTQLAADRKKLAEDLKRQEKVLQETLKRQIEEEKLEHERRLALKMEALLKAEKEKLELAAKAREEELMQKYQSEKSALDRKQQAVHHKEREMDEERKKMQQMAKDVEAETNKKMHEEKVERANERINNKVRRGLLPGNQVERKSKESMQRDNQRIYWAFRHPKGYYLEYYDDLSYAIERAFNQNLKEVSLRRRGIVDFQRWVEIKESGEEACIKRVNSFVGRAVWRFRDNFQWIEFSPQDNFEIEKAWLSRQSNVMVLKGKFLDFNTLYLKIEGVIIPVIRDIIKED
jgi:myosin heavy subunit